MKNRLSIALFLVFQLFFAQEKTIKKPENVIIINNEIATMTDVEKYDSQGLMKSMNKGVTQKFRDQMFKKFGDKIGDKEFIVVVELYTKKEKKENDKKIKVTEKPAVKNDGYILNVDDQAADFTLKLVNGKEVKLSELKGKVVLVNFWATYCGPCLQEFYDVPKKIIEPFKNDDFVFLAIARGESETKVLTKVKKLREDKLEFTIGIDSDKKIWNKYATKLIPKNYLIDQNGIIKYVSTGNEEGNLDKIANEIAKLLKK